MLLVIGDVGAVIVVGCDVGAVVVDAVVPVSCWCCW